MICDFAETYHIFNYKELSPCLVATLLFGLRDDSRVKMHISETKITVEQTLWAIMADALQFIAWSKTTEAKHGKYKNKSILKILRGEYEEEKDDLMSFESIEEYLDYMSQFEDKQ